MLPALAYAGPYEDGKAAINRNDYQTAYTLWRPLADQGNAEAQELIGNMYIAGVVVKQDYAEGVKWIQKAAEQGYEVAQWRLSLIYRHGWFGAKQDWAEALFWEFLAAKKIPPDDIDNPTKHLTPEQIQAVKKRVAEWKPSPSPAAAPPPKQ
jgi:TPR repeat protein